MNIFRILDPFFNALSDGKIIRSVVAVGLRCLAALTALGGVMWTILLLATAAKATETGGIVGGVILAACFGASGFLQTGILLYRARTISDLGPSQFTITAITSVFFRLIGEELFVFFGVVGLGGALYMWFSDNNPLTSMGPLASIAPSSGGRGFLGGIWFGVMFTVIAFCAIIVCYALAELTVVLVDIAKNTGALRLAVAGGGAPTLAAAVDPTPAPRAVAASVANCRTCGNPLEAGNAFCGFCGGTV
jgi:hypothetical protein